MCTRCARSMTDETSRDGGAQICERHGRVDEGGRLELNLRLCDVVNGDFVAHGKDAVKALKLKIQDSRRDPMTATAALFALEMCMKNCGGKFHSMCAAKEVPDAMVKLCEKAPSLDVRDAVLTMIEEWASHLRHEPAYANAYHQLRMRGYKFSEARAAVASGDAARPAASGATWREPARPAETSDWRVRDDISAEDKAAIAAALAETEAEERALGAHAGRAPTSAAPVNAPHLSAMPPNASAEDGDLQRAIRESERMADEARRSTPPHQPSASTTYTTEDVEKLKGDIAIASNSLKVFSQVLDGCIALRPPTPSTLANELVEQCRAMQPRLVELISNATDEALLTSAIRLNDELTGEIARYDLLARAASGDAEARALIAPRSNVEPKHTIESLLSDLDGTQPSTSSPPTQTMTNAQTTTTTTTTTTTMTTNPFGDVLPSTTVTSASGPSSVPVSSPNPFGASVSAPVTIPPSGPRSTSSVTHTNPMFVDDAAHSSSRPTLGVPMRGAPRSPPARTPPRSPVALDPFAHLSAAAADRVRPDATGRAPIGSSVPKT